MKLEPVELKVGSKYLLLCKCKDQEALDKLNDLGTNVVGAINEFMDNESKTCIILSFTSEYDVEVHKVDD